MCCVNWAFQNLEMENAVENRRSGKHNEPNICDEREALRVVRLNALLCMTKYSPSIRSMTPNGPTHTSLCAVSILHPA
jgi:hypothetical protein